MLNCGGKQEGPARRTSTCTAIASALHAVLFFISFFVGLFLSLYLFQQNLLKETVHVKERHMVDAVAENASVFYFGRGNIDRRSSQCCSS